MDPLKSICFESLSFDGLDRSSGVGGANTTDFLSCSSLCLNITGTSDPRCSTMGFFYWVNRGGGGLSGYTGFFLTAWNYFAKSRALVIASSTMGSGLVLLGVLGLSEVIRWEGCYDTIVILSFYGTKVYFFSLFLLSERLNARVVLTFSSGKFLLYSLIVCTLAG